MEVRIRNVDEKIVREIDRRCDERFCFKVLNLLSDNVE